MTTVYRAYSPTRGRGTTVTDDRSCAAELAGIRNQQAAMYPGHTADWTAQTGHVEWETR